MNAQTVSQILDALALKLRVPTAHLWAVLLRQAAIEFWTAVVITIITAGITIVLARLFLAERRVLTGKKEMFPDDGYLVFLGAIMTIAGIATISFLFVVVASVGNVINPEYYALKTVLEALK